MPSNADLLLGKIAVKLRYLTEEQLREAIRIQSAQSPPRPLGEILVEQKFLTPEQLRTALEIQRRKLEAVDPRLREKKNAVLFGKIAVKMGLATEAQVNECLRIQETEGAQGRSLGEIMVEKGYLTREQLHKILAAQQKILMRCPKCSLTFNVLSTRGGAGAKCPRCKGPLEKVQPASRRIPIAPDAEFGTMIARAADLHGRPQPPADKHATTARMIRTSCVICGETFTDAPDETGRVSCPKCHSSFTPKRKF